MYSPAAIDSAPAQHISIVSVATAQLRQHPGV
jgi:hypothetical protein